MEKIRMTLLVPTQPAAGHPYAVQLTYPFVLTPDDEILLTEARFIDQHGKRLSEEETFGAYHPEEWRAATYEEQQEYLEKFGNPQPWYRTLHRVVRSVFDFSGSGDQESNNGQEWSENLDDEWESEERMRDQFRLDEEAWQEKAKAELFRRFEKWGEG